MGMTVYCSATSDPSDGERVYMCFPFPVNLRFLGEEIEDKNCCRRTRLYNSPHFILPTDINAVYPWCYSGKSVYFVFTAILMNRMLGLCVCLCEDNYSVFQCVCCGHAEKITTFDRRNEMFTHLHFKDESVPEYTSSGLQLKDTHPKINAVRWLFDLMEKPSSAMQITFGLNSFVYLLIFDFCS